MEESRLNNDVPLTGGPCRDMKTWALALSPDTSAKVISAPELPTGNRGLRGDCTVAQVIPCLIQLVSLLSQVLILREPLINSAA